jgi:hypothetical protein
MQKQQGFTWSISPQNLPNLIAKLQALDGLGWVINVSQRKSKRTIDQNRRLWKLYRSIGDFTGHSENEMHAYFGNEFLKEHKDIMGKVVETIKSTADLNTAQMAEYQQKIEAFAATNLGWCFENEFTL